MTTRLRLRRLIACLSCLCAPAIFAGPPPASPTDELVAKFLARKDDPPTQYRALRQLDARNERFNKEASMTAWTEFDEARGFRYEIVSGEGSGYIRKHVLEPALEGEAKMVARHEPAGAALSLQNYEFLSTDAADAETDRMTVKPRRKDVLLIDGSLFVKSADADLVRVEGRLSKNPSFWTSSVDVIRRYDRIAGVRVPVALESTAKVRIAGPSHFVMTYEYESINGRRVGNPAPAVLQGTLKTP